MENIRVRITSKVNEDKERAKTAVNSIGRYRVPSIAWPVMGTKRTPVICFTV